MVFLCLYFRQCGFGELIGLEIIGVRCGCEMSMVVNRRKLVWWICRSSCGFPWSINARTGLCAGLRCKQPSPRRQPARSPNPVPSCMSCCRPSEAFLQLPTVIALRSSIPWFDFTRPIQDGTGLGVSDTPHITRPLAIERFQHRQLEESHAQSSPLIVSHMSLEDVGQREFEQQTSSENP